jgi:hypothetical protein
MKYAVFVVLLCVVLVSGCSEPTHTVKGSVSIDGAPLPEGYIAFVPDGSGEGGGSEIKNGSYSLQTAPGKYRVEISASKLMPLPPGQTGMDGAREELRQYIPERYNARTELKVDVPVEGTADFQLDS